ncbi:MAG: tyrosine-type recombinase/integrase, partial [Burkholderiales bacterium]
MATFYRRAGKRGVRWTARVRVKGRQVTRTWATKAAAERWARAQETAIDDGKYLAPSPGSGPILADVIDDFRKHRKRIARPPGQTFDSALDRLKDAHGLEPLGNLTTEFWRKHALDRIAKGVTNSKGTRKLTGSTVAGDLAYASSVLHHAAREGHAVDAAAPGKARTMLREEGMQMFSRTRTRRVTDAEITSIREWIDANAKRTHIPLRDLVDFALMSGMRRGEILALQWTDIDGRVATIKRKHPSERDRVERVPLLKVHPVWPTMDPLDIINRQPKRGPRVFPFNADTLSYWFEVATRGAGVAGVVFHQLRHECLSRLAGRGFDPLRLALVGGHRDLRNVKR